MLAGDWISFDFRYSLDMRRLVPHLVAIEEYKAAASITALPPHWLELSAAGNAKCASGEKPALAEASAPPDVAVPGQENQIPEERKQLPIRDTSAARAWVIKRFVPGGAPISLTDILTIHRMVAEQSRIHWGNAGTLRTSAVKVGRALVGGVHLGAPAQDLPALMEQYIQFVNSPELRTLPPVVHALLAHFFFDTIHPFADGNGRTSRLVAAAVLCSRGYNVHGTYALIRYFYRHEIRYHTILHQSWKRCPFEVTPFVAFGAEGLVIELKSIESFIKMKLNRIVDRDSCAPAFRGRIGARYRTPISRDAL